MIALKSRQVGCLRALTIAGTLQMKSNIVDYVPLSLEILLTHGSPLGPCFQRGSSLAEGVERSQES
jgi:hypothetical protein